MKEIWKDVKGYEGKYKISNHGRLKSLKRKGVKKDKIKTLIKNNMGYSQYILDAGTHVLANRLIAEHFLKKTKNHTKYVLFKDGNKENFKSNNLMWSNKKNLLAVFPKHRDKHQFTEKDINFIRKNYARLKGKKLAKKYGVSLKYIYDIVARRAWKNI